MEVVLISVGVVLVVVSSLGLTLLAGFIIGLVYARYYYDQSEKDGRRHWLSLQRVLSRWVAHYVKRYYFRHAVVYMGGKALEEQVRQCQSGEETAIFAASPHGLFAISTFFLVGVPDWDSSLWRNVRPCIHRHVFATPFVRDLALWLGAIDVSEENVVAMLEHSSILLAPGGTREMIIDADNPIQTLHRGFLRIAFTHKKRVFPVLHVGQERVFRSYSRPWLDRIRAVVLKYIGYPFPTLFMGPFRAPLTTYVLEPHDPLAYDDEESFITDYYATLIAHNDVLSKPR